MMIQRTLLLGLGEAGALVVDQFLAGCRQRWAEIELVQGLAILTEPLPLATLAGPLLVPTQADFPAWRAELEAQAAARLRQISHLKQLSRLDQYGLSLRHPDEVWLFVVANPADPWSAEILAEVVETLRITVYRTLNCQTAVSGLLLVPAEGDAGVGRQVKQLAAHFEHGCFVAGLINETGLVIGEKVELLRRAADFLALLLQEPGLAEAQGPDTGWASFGLATVQWPAGALLETLSAHWSQSLLAELITPPDPPLDMAQKAPRLVEQWLIQERLAPPLLLDSLVEGRPAPLLSLSDFVPDPPWPWLLPGVQRRLEEAGRAWEEEWLAQGTPLETQLAALASAWPARAEAWLVEQLAGERRGSLLLAQSCLAAMSERLLLFSEGVEQKLAETEAGLIDLEGRLSQTAAALQAELAALPASRLTTLLRWGFRPMAWLPAWERCRRVQRLLQAFAHLVRSRLMAWQMVQGYGRLLSFYNRLRAEWREIVARWDDGCREAAGAAQDPALHERAGRPAGSLADAAGPWQEGFVLKLYQEVRRQNQPAVWAAAGGLSDWIRAGLEAGEILRRLQQETGQALSTVLAMPVDQALCRQLPDRERQERWLAGLGGQAQPFWRYDETGLLEAARRQAALKSWLFLPGGEQSPLAALGQDWLSIRSSCAPETLYLVRLRFRPAEPEDEIN